MRKFREAVAALLTVAVLAAAGAAKAQEPDRPVPDRGDRLAFASFVGGGVLMTVAGAYMLGEGVFAYRASGECRDGCAEGYGGHAGVPELVFGSIGLAAGLALLGLGLKVRLEMRRDLALASVEGRF